MTVSNLSVSVKLLEVCHTSFCQGGPVVAFCSSNTYLQLPPRFRLFGTFIDTN